MLKKPHHIFPCLRTGVLVRFELVVEGGSAMNSFRKVFWRRDMVFGFIRARFSSAMKLRSLLSGWSMTSGEIIERTRLSASALVVF